MYYVIMEVDGVEYVYGKYADRRRANEIAMEVRDERRIFVWVQEGE